jgi:hypothetical protein
MGRKVRHVSILKCVWITPNYLAFYEKWHVLTISVGLSAKQNAPCHEKAVFPKQYTG